MSGCKHIRQRWDQQRGGHCTDCGASVGTSTEPQPVSAVKPIYLYRRKGQQAWATCDKERYDELQDMAIFSTMTAYAATDYDALATDYDALAADLAGYQMGAKAEADAGDEARAEVRRLKTEIDALRPQAEALHKVGHALGLLAGTDVVRDVLPDVEALRGHARLSKPPAPAVPDILFESHAVLKALDKKAQSRTSPESVNDVLDAVVRLLRAKPTGADQ